MNTTGVFLQFSVILLQKQKVSYHPPFICEFWGFHGGDVSSRGLLGCDTV